MTEEKDLFEPFRKVNKERHQYAQDWKAKTGGKVIGWMCTYSPLEIMYAAGILPVRILGSHEADRITEGYLYGYICPFAHDCLAQGLRGRYDYLDGIVHAKICEEMLQAFHNWTRHVLPGGFNFFIYHPGEPGSQRGLALLVKEYTAFKEALEKLNSKAISQKDLDRAIDSYNANRKLLKQLYEFRKEEPSLITGEEALQVVRASQIMDVEEHNGLLRQLLKELPNRRLKRDEGVRLMLVGSENDDTELVKTMEELGLTFVIEESCLGTRYFWDEVLPHEDRLEAIASRYLNRWPCPALDWQERKRVDHILKLINEYNVQGVILYRQKFCGPHSYDIPYLTEVLNSHGIPSYVLEFDVINPIGQFRTRIEAFLETLVLQII